MLFVLTAVLLLGSPGPGIAALVAAGRKQGIAGAMPLFGGMQLGLALSAGLSVAGLAALLLRVPSIHLVLSAFALFYLGWIAWRMATAPVGQASINGTAVGGFGFIDGFLLGFANPKAYLAFISLFASFTVLPASRGSDALVKWLACVAVMLAVDIAWLAAGAALGRIPLAPRHERLMNGVMGASIVAAAMLSLL